MDRSSKSYKQFFPKTHPWSCSKNAIIWLLFLLSFSSVFRLCSAQEEEVGPRLTGFRGLEQYNGITENHEVAIPANTKVTLLLFGEGFSNVTDIKFTENPETCDEQFTDRVGGGTVETYPSGDNSSTQYSITFTHSISSTKTYYFCIDFDGTDSVNYMFEHQGSHSWLKLVVQPAVLPLWAEIIFIIILMILSGLFSGLNLGLMALDPTTLKIIKQSGSSRQRTYANIIYRVRRHGNYLLCTLLLGNVIVNSTLTILLDEVLPSGIYAVIASTLAIVIFGEIIPQAICSRHGLLIGAWTIPLTLTFMFITIPLSLPLSLILNCILGKEIGAVYNREQLLKLLHVTQEHHDLVEDEVNIISGVLAYKEKPTKDVMTKFEDVYTVGVDCVLDFKLMREIYDSGFSRIPIYEGERNNIVGLLYVRDLAFVDPDDQTSVQAHMEFYKHELLYVWHDTKLGEVLTRFTSGKSHMAIVQQVNNETDGDPFYENVGVVTLEDIIEEILQQEIVDETDRFVDNRSKKLHKRANFNVAEFDRPSEEVILSSQQRLAVFQFLSTAVEPFQKTFVSDNVLKRLLTKNVVRKISLEEANRTNLQLYTSGKESSFFTLVLEGCMEVQIGKDGLTFDSKSFTYFGAQALLNCALDSPVEYIPDFTVKPSADSTVIIITQHQYLAAREATRFEEGRGGGENTDGGAELVANSENTDVFAEKWKKAQDQDIQDSHSTGLSSITKLLSKKHKYTHQDSTSDKRHLLTQSSESSEESPYVAHKPLEMRPSTDTLEDRYQWFPSQTGTVESQSDGGLGTELTGMDGIRDYSSEPTTTRQRTSVSREEWALNTSSEV